jgi:hypothetical protein
MAEIDFYYQFLKTGKIEGLDLYSKPEDWINKLGSQYIDDTKKKVKRIDYGVVELSFYLNQKEWECVSITIQAQRLRYNEDNDLVPGVLIEHYGTFSANILFKDLRRTTSSKNLNFELIEDRNQRTYRRYYSAVNQAIVNTIPEEAPLEEQNIEPGSIWSINRSPSNANSWSKPSL